MTGPRWPGRSPPSAEPSAAGRAPRTLARWAETTRAGVEVSARSGSWSGPLPYDAAHPHVRRALAELANAAAALQRGDRDVAPLGMWHERDDRDHATRKPDPYLGLERGCRRRSRWRWPSASASSCHPPVGTGPRSRPTSSSSGPTRGEATGGRWRAPSGHSPASWAASSSPHCLGQQACALVLIFVLLFAAWWLQPVSFFAGSVCVTVVLALLYVLLGTYSGTSCSSASRKRPWRGPRRHRRSRAGAVPEQPRRPGSRGRRAGPGRRPGPRHPS